MTNRATATGSGANAPWLSVLIPVARGTPAPVRTLQQLASGVATWLEIMVVHHPGDDIEGELDSVFSADALVRRHLRVVEAENNADWLAIVGTGAQHSAARFVTVVSGNAEVSVRAFEQLHEIAKRGPSGIAAMVNVLPGAGASAGTSCAFVMPGAHERSVCADHRFAIDQVLLERSCLQRLVAAWPYGTAVTARAWMMAVALVAGAEQAGIALCGATRRNPAPDWRTEYYELQQASALLANWGDAGAFVGPGNSARAARLSEQLSSRLEYLITQLAQVNADQRGALGETLSELEAEDHRLHGTDPQLQTWSLIRTSPAGIARPAATFSIDELEYLRGTAE